jgi:cytochrome c551
MNRFWLLLLFAFTWVALSACGPGSGNATYQSLSTADQAKFEKYMILGKTVYTINCSNCHQFNGKGLRGLIPPLATADYLEHNQQAIPCLLKGGSKDSLMVNGRIYPPQMPAHNISNLELAEVITYINNSWGNEFGFVPVIEVDKLLMECE